MARRVFFSFYYDGAARANVVRNSDQIIRQYGECDSTTRAFRGPTFVRCCGLAGGADAVNLSNQFRVYG